MSSHYLSCPLNQLSWPKAVRRGSNDERDLSIFTPSRGHEQARLYARREREKREERVLLVKIHLRFNLVVFYFLHKAKVKKKKKFIFI